MNAIFLACLLEKAGSKWHANCMLDEASQTLSVLALKFNYLNPGLTTVLWVDCATQYEFG